MLILNLTLEIEKNGILIEKSVIYCRMLVEAHFQLVSSNDPVTPSEHLKCT
jgi:hypothetical protein